MTTFVMLQNISHNLGLNMIKDVMHPIFLCTHCVHVICYKVQYAVSLEWKKWLQNITKTTFVWYLYKCLCNVKIIIIIIMLRWLVAAVLWHSALMCVPQSRYLYGWVLWTVCSFAACWGLIMLCHTHKVIITVVIWAAKVALIKDLGTSVVLIS